MGNVKGETAEAGADGGDHGKSSGEKKGHGAHNGRYAAAGVPVRRHSVHVVGSSGNNLLSSFDGFCLMVLVESQSDGLALQSYEVPGESR